MKFTLVIVSWIILPMIVFHNRGVAAGPMVEAMTGSGAVLPAATVGIPAQVNPYVTSNPTALAKAFLPTLSNFVTSLKNNQSGTIVGVYVADVLALPVTQQPINNPAYVSPNLGNVTQFRLATQYGSSGFLAHNNLSGALFFNLRVGQEVAVIYGDEGIRRYRISIIRRLQALRPTDPASNYLDLDHLLDPQISNADLFHEIYASGDRVIFQTCINANGNPSWGRLFVIAIPIS